MDGFWDEHPYTPTVYHFMEYRAVGLINGWAVENNRPASQPHNNGTNVVFVDGHVEYADYKGSPANPNHFLWNNSGALFSVPSGGTTIMW